jgi:YVTN family beta-propeller protein
MKRRQEDTRRRAVTSPNGWRLNVMRAVFIALLVTVVGAHAASAVSRPMKPRVIGPRRTTDRTPTFRFVSNELGVPSRELRFRCALDTGRFHPCPHRYTPSLRIGRHLLHVVALDRRGRRSPTATVVVHVVQRTPGPVQTIRVGQAPYNVAYGFGALWVAIDHAVVRIDPTTRVVNARIDVGGRPWGMEVAENVLWVGNDDNHTIAAVDPATNTVSRRIVVDGSPVGVAVGGGAIWAANHDDGRVWRLDPATGRVLSVAHVGDAHEFIGYSEGRVWVASEDGTVGQLDSATGVVTKTINLGAGADVDYLGFSQGSVWATAYKASALFRIDAASGKIAQRFPIYAGPQGVVDDGHSLWLAFYKAGAVLRLDRVSGAIRARFSVGRLPRGLTVAAGSVWVANSGASTISRIKAGR